jgi:hypothetical protein
LEIRTQETSHAQNTFLWIEMSATCDHVQLKIFINVYFKLNSVLKTNYTILKYKNRIKS